MELPLLPLTATGQVRSGNPTEVLSGPVGNAEVLPLGQPFGNSACPAVPRTSEGGRPVRLLLWARPAAAATPTPGRPPHVPQPRPPCLPRSVPGPLAPPSLPRPRPRPPPEALLSPAAASRFFSP